MTNGARSGVCRGGRRAGRARRSGGTARMAGKEAVVGRASGTVRAGRIKGRGTGRKATAGAPPRVGVGNFFDPCGPSSDRPLLGGVQGRPMKGGAAPRGVMFDAFGVGG